MDIFMDVLTVTLVRVLAVVLIALVWLAMAWLRKKIGEAGWAEIMAAVDKAVKAAEQIFSDPKSGAKKKQWVLDFINSKFKIDQDDVERLLEAFVYELNKDQLQPLLYEATLEETTDAIR